MVLRRMRGGELRSLEGLGCAPGNLPEYGLRIPYPPVASLTAPLHNGKEKILAIPPPRPTRREGIHFDRYIRLSYFTTK